MLNKQTFLESAYSQKLNTVLDEFKQFRKEILPLCAAETPISDYVRSFLLADVHEKYAMGGLLESYSGNFMGAHHVHDIHQLIVDLCSTLFDANYADPRPSTGLGAVTNLLMTLSEPGQKIALQTTESGGHPSMKPVCKRLGLEIVDLPYDYEGYNLSVTGVNELFEKNDIGFLLYAPSDILYEPDFRNIAIPDNVVVIYDATQTLGLISSRCLLNPITDHPRFILLGGTHKTLPGPSSGLIMTNNADLALRIDTELNPKFLRHSQPHQMASLAACLIEQLAIGRSYGERIQIFSEVLGHQLKNSGIEVLQYEDQSTQTHQIFINIEKCDLEEVFNRFAGIGVTLNKKTKRLFRNSGLRIGVQELARYQWSEGALVEIAELLTAVIKNNGDAKVWRDQVRAMSTRNIFNPELILKSQPGYRPV